MGLYTVFNKTIDLPEDISVISKDVYLFLVCGDSILEYVYDCKVVEDLMDKLESNDISCYSDILKEFVDRLDYQDLYNTMLIDKMIDAASDKGIYDITGSDIISNNKSYNEACLSVVNLKRELNLIEVNYQKYGDELVRNAEKRANESIHGVNYGIITNSIVASLAYGYFNESAIERSAQAAQWQFDKEFEKIWADCDEDIAKAQYKYVFDVFLPSFFKNIKLSVIEGIINYFNCIQRGTDGYQFLCDYDFVRSNDLLKNITSANKEKVLYQAYKYCPLNPYVFIAAIDNGLMDNNLIDIAQSTGMSKLICKKLIDTKYCKYDIKKEKLSDHIQQQKSFFNTISLLSNCTFKCAADENTDYVLEDIRNSIYRTPFLDKPYGYNSNKEKRYEEAIIDELEINNFRELYFDRPIKARDSLFDTFCIKYGFTKEQLDDISKVKDINIYEEISRSVYYFDEPVYDFSSYQQKIQRIFNDTFEYTVERKIKIELDDEIERKEQIAKKEHDNMMGYIFIGILLLVCYISSNLQ